MCIICIVYMYNKTDQCSLVLYILTPASDIPLLNVNSHQYTGQTLEVDL